MGRPAIPGSRERCHRLPAPLFGLKSAADSAEAVCLRLGGMSSIKGLVMSIAYPPHADPALIPDADNLVPDTPFKASPRSARAETFADDEAPSDEVLWLLEENARLRKIAVKLSNLLGDLPAQDWEDAVAAALKERPADGANVKARAFGRR
jgi:hypothetical protein